MVLLFCAGAAVCVFGCGPGETQVRGTVTLDGQDVAHGMIQFIPLDGDRPTAGAVIANGRYEAKVPPGRARVTINMPEVVGQQKAYDDQPDSPLIDVHRERLPARYTSREKSELSIDVVPGKNEQNFELASDKKKK